MLDILVPYISGRYLPMLYGLPAADAKAKAESRMAVRFQPTYLRILRVSLTVEEVLMTFTVHPT